MLCDHIVEKSSYRSVHGFVLVFERITECEKWGKCGKLSMKRILIYLGYKTFDSWKNDDNTQTFCNMWIYKIKDC